MSILQTRTYCKGGEVGRGMELNFGGFEMQKWNIPTVRAQRVGEKIGVICCLFILFTSGLMVIKKSKMANFCIFCQQLQKISHSLDKIFTCIWKILLRSFWKCYGLLDFELPLARCQPLKIQSFFILLLT